MMSFKIFVALEKVWPHFLKHLQLLKEAYLDDFLDKEGVPMPDFYEFNNMDNPDAGGKPKRDMIVEQDNAKYNHGVECHIKSYTKKQCADVLRKLGVNQICSKHLMSDGTLSEEIYNAEVPEDGQNWKMIRDYPSKADVHAATIKILQEKCPACIEPAFMYVVNRKPQDRGFTINVTNTAPYTSPIVSVEFKWMNGIGYVGKAENQWEGRSPADVVKLMLKKWYNVVEGVDRKRQKVLKSPIHPKVFIDHVHKEMNKRIEKLQKEGSTLLGNIFNLSGGPKTPEEHNEWRKRAGMTEKTIELEDNEESIASLDGDFNGAGEDDIDPDNGDEDNASTKQDANDEDESSDKEVE